MCVTVRGKMRRCVYACGRHIQTGDEAQTIQALTNASHVLSFPHVPSSPVSNKVEVLEVLSQSSEMAVTWTVYFSPHLSMVIWQLVEADVQFRDAPVPSTAVALYVLAPNTKSQVTVTMPLEQL